MNALRESLEPGALELIERGNALALIPGEPRELLVGSGVGLGGAIPRGYSTTSCAAFRARGEEAKLK